MNLQYFQNVKVIFPPTNSELVVFSCDEKYFEKFGIYNIFSCNEVGNDVHVHIINPSETSLEKIHELKNKLQINLSASYEKFDFFEINFYALKSYYYCSRFFVTIFLVENFNVNSLHIVDADMIFNEKVIWDSSINLVLDYNKDASTLWKKIMAGYIFIKKEKINFLKEVVKEFFHRYSSTDFDEVEKINDKITKANFTGLDQVCLSFVFENNLKYNDLHFFNMFTAEKKFKSKYKDDAMMWMILGKSKNNIESLFKEKYKKYL